MRKLQIITSPTKYEMIEKEKDQLTTNKPFTRHCNIVSALENLKLQIDYVELDTTHTEKELLELRLADKTYINFLKEAYKSYEVDLLNNGEYESPYDRGLINYYFTSRKNNVEKLPYHLQCGFYTDDVCTSIFEHTYITALSSAANSLFVSSKIDDLDRKIIYCANIFGGHHSTNSGYNGYCFLNNAAICAKHLIQSEKYRRIAILDVDFHHGDGTQTIFAEDKDVLTISIHGDPKNNYPFYTGYTDENTPSNFNFPLCRNTDMTKYIETLEQALELVKLHNADIVIIPFGGDTYNDDPQGSFKLLTEDYKTMGKIIADSIIQPIIVTQEGGYELSVIGDIVGNFLLGLSE